MGRHAGGSYRQLRAEPETLPGQSNVRSTAVRRLAATSPILSHSRLHCQCRRWPQTLVARREICTWQPHCVRVLTSNDTLVAVSCDPTDLSHRRRVRHRISCRNRLRRSDDSLNPLGDLFSRLLNMPVVPIIVFTLVTGVRQLSPARLGRIGGATVGLYAVTTTIAGTIGLLVANVLRPGRGVEYTGGEAQSQTPPSLTEVLWGSSQAIPSRRWPMATFSRRSSLSSSSELH